ncbi:MAG: PadR family transcriptional regulator [Prevotellaceae bacterium]|jgi:PadR family transcriptional regulator PadR|nr:PadR family transcriptional regulator [Prevotellaceae bacterium]
MPEFIHNYLDELCSKFNRILWRNFVYICKMNNDFIEKWKSQVKKGVLTFIVLNLLKHREMYGYELIEHVSKTISIDIAEGTLYPLLNKLKTEGLVASKWVEQISGIPRKYYSLTNIGEYVLSKMKESWEQLTDSIKGISK